MRANITSRRRWEGLGSSQNLGGSQCRRDKHQQEGGGDQVEQFQRSSSKPLTARDQGEMSGGNLGEIQISNGPQTDAFFHQKEADLLDNYALVISGGDVAVMVSDSIAVKTVKGDLVISPIEELMGQSQSRSQDDVVLAQSIDTHANVVPSQDKSPQVSNQAK